MLFVEAAEHRIQPRSLAVNIDHIRRPVASAAFHLFDLFVEGGKHGVRRSVGGYA